MEKLAQKHLSGVKRVLRYVKGTSDYGLFIKKGDSNSKVIGFIHTDFAGDISDEKSTSYHIFLLIGMAVSGSLQK